MNNKLLCAISFVAGAAVGAAGVWLYFKNTYEEVVPEELDESEDEEDDSPDTEQTESATYTKPSLKEYASKILDEGYTASEEDKKEEEVTPIVDFDKPYVISPDDFGESGYEMEELTYYADKTLTDVYNNVIENVDELVGADFYTHFGEYQDDTVFVRNDELETDFEICIDTRNYSDVVGVYDAED